MINKNQVTCYKLTFEAILAVRAELAATPMDDTIKTSEIMLRLSGLYASIDAAQFIECMAALEAQNANVIKVDFKTKKAQLKQAVNAPLESSFTEDEIPF